MELSVTDAEEKPKRTIAEIFDEAFPHYLAMGMTYEQFWEQDCSLVIPYRKAWQIRQENENRLAWLHGMYIYEALCDVSPLLRAFAKSGTQAHPYAEKPCEFGRKGKKSREETNQRKTDNTIRYMQELMRQFNQSNANRKRSETPAERK